MLRDREWNRVDIGEEGQGDGIFEVWDKGERQEGGMRIKVQRDKKNRGKDLWRGGTMQRDKEGRVRKGPQSATTS
jgi:hypothetical protein